MGSSYSRVVYCGISSAGKFCSDKCSAYCGGKWFLVKQKGQVQSFERKSTWHPRVQYCPAVGVLAPYRIVLHGGECVLWVLDFNGVNKHPTGTTIRVASSREDGHIFQEKRTPSLSSAPIKSPSGHILRYTIGMFQNSSSGIYKTIFLFAPSVLLHVSFC